MVFAAQDLKGVLICNHRADGHNLICPVGFRIDHRKISHFSTSLAYLIRFYHKFFLFATFPMLQELPKKFIERINFGLDSYGIMCYT